MAARATGPWLILHLMQIFTCGKALLSCWQDKLTLWDNLPRTVSTHPRQICRHQRVQLSGRRKLLEWKDSLNQLVARDFLEHIHRICNLQSLFVKDRAALEPAF